MTTKEKVKRKIDKMPDNLIKKVYDYINSLESKKTRKVKIRTFNLKGQLDDVNVRKRAYE